MVHGQAEINMREFDPRRFGGWATKDYTEKVSIADYQHMYYCYKPAEQHLVGRELRKSTTYDQMKAHGARFSQVFGWETPRWFAPDGEGEAYSFRHSNWWNSVRGEALAVREQVGLMDLSAFAKFDILGKDANVFLERICANAIPRHDGGIALAHLLNENGFIESEITVTRLGKEHFYVISAAAAQLHDFDELRMRRRDSEAVVIDDVTDVFGTLVLAGPRSREALAACADADVSNTSFPWFTGKSIEVAGIPGVRALRISYVGELCFELHCKAQVLPRLFEALMEAGAPYGIRLFGTYAMNSLRMEKAYRGFGSELTNEVDMFEASMERFIRLDKPDFIGKAASLVKKQRGARIKLVYLRVEAGDSDCRGNEPVYHGDKLVGATTSGAYGHTVGASLAFAYVDPTLIASGTKFDVLVLGQRRKAQVLAEPAWDAANIRLRM
jgi:dimethylglycine dehydrogenase